MKKRRELDALVGNGKCRKKIVSKRAGHELLPDNDSESSDGDYFNSSSIKTKGGGFCCTCSSVLAFLLLLACILVCAGLTWMYVEMKQDLETLQAGLEAVENKNGENSESLHKLSSGLADVNRTLKGVTSGTNSIEQILADLAAVQSKIAKLNDRVKTVSEGLKAAPEIREIPAKLLTFSKTVADLGSDVSGMKDQVTAFDAYMKTTDSKLEKLDEVSKKIEESAPSEYVTPDFAHMFQSIPVRIDTLNASISARLAVIQSSLQEHMTHFTHLENVTMDLGANLATLTSDHTAISTDHASMTSNHSSIDPTSDEFKSLIQGMVHNMISNTRTNTTGTSVNLDQSTMRQLLGNMDNLTTAVAGLKDQYEKLKAAGAPPGGEQTVPLEMLQDLGEGFEKKITSLNNSIVSLQYDVDHFTKQLGLQAMQLVNLTHHMTANRYSIIRQQHIIDIVQNTTETTTAGTAAAASTTVEPAMSSTTQAKAVTKTMTEQPTESAASSTHRPASTPAISISYIKTADDLDTNFRRWDLSNTGYVSYSTLQDYIGPDIPDEIVLKQFDADGNGLYSIDEFAAALGITLENPEKLPDEGGRS